MFNKLFIKLVSRYTISGIMNNIIYYFIYITLLKIIKVNYLFSMTVAYAFSIFSGYLLNSKFAFQYKTSNVTKFLEYSSLYISTYFLNLIFLYFFVDIMAIEPLVSQLISTVLIAIINFIFLKNLIFKKKEQ